MSRERYVYALSDWTVEKRERGWYYARSANRHSSTDWRGPYRSEASVAMMIASSLSSRTIPPRHNLRSATEARRRCFCRGFEYSKPPVNAPPIAQCSKGAGSIVVVCGLTAMPAALSCGRDTVRHVFSKEPCEVRLRPFRRFHKSLVTAP